MAVIDAPIKSIEVGAYATPTDAPESDGTYAWNRTVLVTALVHAGGAQGFGYTYADRATAVLIHEVLAPVVQGADALQTNARWLDMQRAVRNLGRPGIASMAIAAVDAALWDLKGKLYGVSVAALLGPARDAIAIYGSGGFTSYDTHTLCAQLSGWAETGIRMMKMKIGREPTQDIERVQAAHAAIGGNVELFVDANGAYTRKQALAFAEAFASCGVTWFEEPVSSDDLAGLRLLRDRAPAGMAISAGEYGYESFYFRRMLEAQAVDVLQADATRCGVTGLLAAATLAEAFGVPLSSHCAPALHLPLCCAARPVVHLEYFHDHARIESMLFDGVATPRDGVLQVPMDRSGFGFSFKSKDAARYALH